MRAFRLDIQSGDYPTDMVGLIRERDDLLVGYLFSDTAAQVVATLNEEVAEGEQGGGSSYVKGCGSNFVNEDYDEQFNGGVK